VETEWLVAGGATKKKKYSYNSIAYV
jgi:hypothetical protein